jgi:hypothetical protein
MAAVAGLLAAAAPLPAHADGAHFRGSCRFSVVTDTTPGGRLGGQDAWNGEVDVLVVADDAGSISATCSIKVNGVDQGVVLDAGSGTGFVAAAGPLTFRAGAADGVALCTNVTTSAGAESWCGFGPERPLCPDDVCGDGAVLDQVVGVLDQVLDVLDGLVGAGPPLFEVADPTLCPVLLSLRPTVNALPTAGLLSIGPDGDVFLGGTTADDLFWDCPPYTVR